MKSVDPAARIDVAPPDEKVRVEGAAGRQALVRALSAAGCEPAVKAASAPAARGGCC